MPDLVSGLLRWIHISCVDELRDQGVVLVLSGTFLLMDRLPSGLQTLCAALFFLFYVCAAVKWNNFHARVRPAIPHNSFKIPPPSIPQKP